MLGSRGSPLEKILKWPGSKNGGGNGPPQKVVGGEHRQTGISSHLTLNVALETDTAG